MNRPKMTMTPRDLRDRARMWVEREFSALPLGVVECYAEHEGLGSLYDHVVPYDPANHPDILAMTEALQDAIAEWDPDSGEGVYVEVMTSQGYVSVSSDVRGYSDSHYGATWDEDGDLTDPGDAHRNDDIVRGTLFATSIPLDSDMIRRHGMVPIEGWGELPDTLIGLSGAGSDVYDAHWIPLYLDWLRESWDVEITEEEA